MHALGTYVFPSPDTPSPLTGNWFD